VVGLEGLWRLASLPLPFMGGVVDGVLLELELIFGWCGGGFWLSFFIGWSGS